jgi:HEAT repeat protein
MGPAAAPHAPRLLPFLEDDDVEVRRLVVAVLGNMGPSSAPLLRTAFEDSSELVRVDAAKALGAMGPAVAPHAPLLLPLLADGEEFVRVEAAQALGMMGNAAAQHARFLLHLLEAESEWVRKDATTVLVAMAPVDVEAVGALLSRAHEEPESRSRWLLSAHEAGGGEPRLERLIRWLGRTDAERPAQLMADEARATLQAFADLWPFTEAHQPLRAELATQIAAVVHLARGEWKRTDLPLLQAHERNLERSHPKSAETVRGVILSSQK